MEELPSDGCDPYHRLSIIACPLFLQSRSSRQNLLAGVVLRVSPTAYATIGLNRDEEGHLTIAFPFVIRDTEGKFSRQASPSPIYTEELISGQVGGSVGSRRALLRIEARPESYTLITLTKDGAITLQESVQSEAFYPLFTGTHLGIHAFGGKYEPVRAPATFRYVEMKYLEV